MQNNAQFSLKSCILTCPLWFSGNISQISQRKCKHCTLSWRKDYPWCIMIYPQCNSVLILPLVIINLLPRINTWGDCLFTWKFKFTVDPLKSNHQSPPWINTWGDCLFTWKFKFTVDPLNSDHQPPPPPDQQRRQSPQQCWLLIRPGSTLSIDPPTFRIFNM